MEQLKVLYGEGDARHLTALKAALTKAGFKVTTAVGRNDFQHQLAGTKFDVAVLGHTLSRDDRHHLPYMIRKANADTQILVLHASGKHPEVDLAMDSRRGEHAVLDAIEQLAGRLVAA